jgi:intein/homing endonuclease
MAYKEVEWLFQRDVEETYNITVGGEVITTTDEHPLWIVGKGWVEAQHLAVGDVLTTSDGKELAIEKIEVKKEHTKVYNFMVKDFHTYFVSNLGIWTHNACFHKHHVFPQQFRDWFSAREINIDDFTVKIDSTTHLKGVHGKGLEDMPGKWNDRWSEFMEAKPNATQQEVLDFGNSLLKEYGLDGIKFEPYK